MNTNALKSIADLRENSSTAILASLNGDEYPVMRAMLIMEHDSIGTQYFSTNTSSGKVVNFRKNSKASVYYCRPEEFKGALFVGDMEVCEDQKTKDFLWREGCEMYYPKGVTDPDYCVLKFTARYGSYYHGLNSTTFTIAELNKNLGALEELTGIIKKFASSGWDLIEGPSKDWLEGNGDAEQLRTTIKEADKVCGSCGCEFDPLYKRALQMTELF